MRFHKTTLKGAFVVEIEPIADERGWFARTFCKREFDKIGHTGEWVQLNHSYTKSIGSIRGIHYQDKPHTETKLVRCISGKVYDVIVDLREGSDTFLKWFGKEISAENKMMMYIPAGFGHGFQTLTNDCELIYHHTEFFEKSSESGIRYNDDLIKITWPLKLTDISDRDSKHPLLNKNFKGI